MFSAAATGPGEGPWCGPSCRFWVLGVGVDRGQSDRASMPNESLRTFRQRGKAVVWLARRRSRWIEVLRRVVTFSWFERPMTTVTSSALWAGARDDDLLGATGDVRPWPCQPR